MPVFVRMIARAKWEQNDDLRKGEIAALAMAASWDRLDRLDIVYLDEEGIRPSGLRTRATPGNTPVSSLRSSHIDVAELDLDRLGTIAAMIATAHRTYAVLKISRLEVLAILVRAVRDGLVSTDALRGDLKTKVEAALRIS